MGLQSWQFGVYLVVWHIFFGLPVWLGIFQSWTSPLVVSAWLLESFAGQDVAEATEQRKKEHEEFGIPLNHWQVGLEGGFLFLFWPGVEIHTANLRFDSATDLFGREVFGGDVRQCGCAEPVKGREETHDAVRDLVDVTSHCCIAQTTRLQCAENCKHKSRHWWFGWRIFLEMHLTYLNITWYDSGLCVFAHPVLGWFMLRSLWGSTLHLPLWRSLVILSRSRCCGIGQFENVHTTRQDQAGYVFIYFPCFWAGLASLNAIAHAAIRLCELLWPKGRMNTCSKQVCSKQISIFCTSFAPFLECIKFCPGGNCKYIDVFLLCFQWLAEKHNVSSEAWFWILKRPCGNSITAQQEPRMKMPCGTSDSPIGTWYRRLQEPWEQHTASIPGEVLWGMAKVQRYLVSLCYFQVYLFDDFGESTLVCLLFSCFHFGH